MDSKTEAEINKKFKNALNKLVLLDYDGTLVNYELIPDNARLPEHMIDILLKIAGKKRSGYALYVGKTNRKTEERFQQHKDGYKASRYVKKYGVCLLPDLFEHLNPMSGTEATELEVSIAEALKHAGVPTYGGH